MTAILESLTQQIFREAADVATDNKKKRIAIEHIDQAIQDNAALQKAYADAVISAGEKFVHKSSPLKSKSAKKSSMVPKESRGGDGSADEMDDDDDDEDDQDEDDEEEDVEEASN